MAHAIYRNDSGKRLPSVTTIIGRFKESGALMQWAYKEGVRQGESGMVTRLYDARDEAAAAGTLAHKMVECRIKGEPQPRMDDDNKDVFGKALQAFKAYRSWESMTKLELVESEVQLVSEQYQFGGTLDAIGRIDDELCLVDVKTSNSVYPDYLIQLAAYKQMWEENYPRRPLTGGFHLCRFAKEHGDFAHHYFPDLSDAWEMFKLYRQAYDLDKELKKRVR